MLYHRGCEYNNGFRQRRWAWQRRTAHSARRGPVNWIWRARGGAWHRVRDRGGPDAGPGGRVGIGQVGDRVVCAAVARGAGERLGEDSVPAASECRERRRAVDLLALPEREMRRRRGSDVAMVFQEPMTALNPVMRVGAQIAEAVRAHQPGLSSKAVDRLVLDAMREVALPEPERRARDYPHQFSGGQRQRILIAMAIVNRPSAADCRRADDGAGRHRAGADSGAAEGPAPGAWALHAVYLARPRCGGRGLRPAGRSRRGDAAGRIVEQAETRELFVRPQHAYTRRLLASAPTMASDRTRPLSWQ